MGLVIGITFLFVVSAMTPIIGYDVRTTDSVSNDDDYDFYYFDKFHPSEISNYDFKQKNTFDSKSTISLVSSAKSIKKEKTSAVGIGPMDSAWPMKCHDTRHTSRSPYSTENNLGVEIWRFRSEHHLGGTMESSPVISDDGTVYFGTMGCDHKLYALYPNGTKKWSYPVGLTICSKS